MEPQQLKNKQIKCSQSLCRWHHFICLSVHEAIPCVISQGLTLGPFVFKVHMLPKFPYVTYSPINRHMRSLMSSTVLQLNRDQAKVSEHIWRSEWHQEVLFAVTAVRCHTSSYVMTFCSLLIGVNVSHAFVSTVTHLSCLCKISIANLQLDTTGSVSTDTMRNGNRCQPERDVRITLYLSIPTGHFLKGKYVTGLFSGLGYMTFCSNANMLLHVLTETVTPTRLKIRDILYKTSS